MLQVGWAMSLTRNVSSVAVTMARDVCDQLSFRSDVYFKAAHVPSGSLSMLGTGTAIYLSDNAHRVFDDPRLQAF